MPKLVFAHLSDIHFTHGLSDVSRLDPDRILRQAILADAKVLLKTRSDQVPRFSQHVLGALEKKGP
jgi:hypothetical protein